ncbi:hypothetical protein [Sphaerisporangium aureirubrum]|uniref:Lipoprotein n=1 Tax=Sphaerisporangium aureirubrum TaxID=1544736 RepID=A0ABW1NRY7_9ACTN
MNPSHPSPFVRVVVAAALLGTALAACSSTTAAPATSPPALRATPLGARPSPPASEPVTRHPAPTAARGADGCPVTRPSDRKTDPPPEVPGRGDRWYGGGRLWVSLPDPEYRAERQPDGYYALKVGWWRLAEGQLHITVNRSEVEKGTFIPEVPSGYGPTGFQPTGLTFSSPGCWHIIGTLADTEIDFWLRIP